MKFGGLQILLAAVLAIVAGGFGAYAANEWRERPSQPGLDNFVHSELALTAEQNAKLERIEVQFAVERKVLELSLRAANARLAAAMEDEHAYGPKVAAAIDEVHARMGDLQKATIRHVFAMRALLDTQQQSRFDHQVTAALTSEPGE